MGILLSAFATLALGSTSARATVGLGAPPTATEGDVLELTASWSGEEIVADWGWDVDQLHGLTEPSFAWCADEGTTLRCETGDDGLLVIAVEAFGGDGAPLGRAEVEIEVQNRAPEILGLPDVLTLEVGESYDLDWTLDDVEGDGPGLRMLMAPDWCALVDEGASGQIACDSAEDRGVRDLLLVAEDEEGGRSERQVLVEVVPSSDEDDDDPWQDDDDDAEGSDYEHEVWGDSDISCSCCGSGTAAVLLLPLGLFARRRRR